MTGSKLFLDTSAIEAGYTLTTSVLTIAEFGIKPRKLNRNDILSKFRKTVKNLFDVYENKLGRCRNIFYVAGPLPIVKSYRFSSNSLCYEKPLQ